MVARTSDSVTLITGSRLVFWLQPATSALSVSGYVSGTVRCFSTSTPSTRVSRSDNSGSVGRIAFRLTLSIGSSLAAIGRGEARLGKLVRVEHESDQRAARFGVGVDLVDLERV